MTLRATFDGAHIKPDDPTALTRYKHTLAPGAKLAMTLEPWDERRTPSQQRLLHEMLGRLAREQGMTLEVVKVQLKVDQGHYVPAERILSGEVVPKWRGRFVDLADVYEAYPQTIIFLRSEADYTRKMEGEFIDRVILACQEAGVDVSDILEQLSHDRA